MVTLPSLAVTLQGWKRVTLRGRTGVTMEEGWCHPPNSKAALTGPLRRTSKFEPSEFPPASFLLH